MKIKITIVKYIPVLLTVTLINISCNRSDTNFQFEVLKGNSTGLNFENKLTQTREINIFDYMYFFNGAGVGVGDFNNDDKVDLYFASNMGSNKLFLNKGNMKFIDVTEVAGVDGNGGWSTGVSIVDINSDGLLDIYVNQVGASSLFKGKNILYVNKGLKKGGIPKFEDQAACYGLDLTGFSTQSAFFDYDLDGDLDMYQLNHSVHENGTFGKRESFLGKQHPTAGDKLFRNDNGKYVEITKNSGILSLAIGYGLGITTGDVNNDGWPDIYIGNDFHENDYLYINQQDGTFKEVLTDQMRHTSHYSMGVDMADINNDGLIDIMSLDMLPDDPYILKSSLGDQDFDLFKFKLKFGYAVQFARNNLQLNNGDGTFSEIGMLANVHATDWSWAPLFLDFDNDGCKDLFVSNGIPRRMNDIDYVKFRENNEDHKWKTQAGYIDNEELVLIKKIPQIKIPNKFFENSGKLIFQDIAGQIKDNTDTFSNGAAFADLDNDGDLDVVVNNIDDQPYIYRNLTIENSTPNHHYIRLKFKGIPDNTFGIGAKTIVYKGKEKLIAENYPVRGFQSSVEPGVHLGIGDISSVDSILVIWPDGKYQNITGLAYDSTHVVHWHEDLLKYNFNTPEKSKNLDFLNITEAVGLNFHHEENEFVEFDRERLIPFMVSTEGPALAVGDMNGDGLEDIFLGSSKRKRSKVFFQKSNGTFNEKTPQIILNDSIFEDVDATLTDIDNDGDLDLAVASGGNEYWGKSEYLQQRLYINDGLGVFEDRITFDGAYMTASCVVSSDFNNDGLIDFFFGGRAVPRNYGKIPTSYLFQNMGNRIFKNVTNKYSDKLSKVGMVKNGQWKDIDEDGDPDLVLAVEWGPITIFINNGNEFEMVEVSSNSGWWTHVLAHDFDKDGDIDILAGNIGKNTRFKPTHTTPIKLYVEDFDDNGQIDQILTYYLGGREIPFANYSELTKQLPSLKKRYLYAKNFAAASIEDLFGADKIESADVLEVNTLESIFFENRGDLKFNIHPLPVGLQFSTFETSLLHNFDGSIGECIIAGGNFYENNIQMGRYDASYGNLLTIGKDGAMEVQSIGSFSIKGQVRNIQAITIKGETSFVFVRNNQATLLIKPILNDQVISNVLTKHALSGTIR